jgi:two-component system, LytTR family, sensor kinase
MYHQSLARGAALTLRDAVDIPVLQRIQDTFSEAMGFAAVTVDKLGTPLTRQSCFRRICRIIRSTEKGLARCMECDAEGGLAAQARGKPHIYQCRGGLLDIAAPIMIQGEYVGSFLCGQVVSAEAREDFVEDVVRRNSALGVPIDEIRSAALEIPSVARERVDAAAQMLFQMANYIVEMGAANIMQTELLAEAKERAALQAELQNAQLRMLESQINPHFLFNALGLISYTAMQENAQQTQEISYCLSDLLRYGLRNLAVPVTLGQEVDVTQRYLDIQKLRFGSRINVQIELDPSVNEVRVPCMVLQPLVENAVVHSVEPLARTVNVLVRATRGEGKIILEVADNGVGIEPGVLNTIRTRSFPTKPSGHSLGLRNLIRRLELEYGNGFDFTIESDPGRGTRIVLSIPLASRAA